MLALKVAAGGEDPWPDLRDRRDMIELLGGTIEVARVRDTRRRETLAAFRLELPDGTVVIAQVPFRQFTAAAAALGAAGR